MSTTLAQKASRFLERRSDRRGFLRRSALVGTAMAAAPTTYVLKPKTAYAAICNCSGSNCDCGALCCDGYTEFCCTLNGVNGCPPGTSYGGWWKADGSGYCDNGTPQPRYYLDCNAACNNCGCGASGVCAGSCSGTPCGCANGSCNNRKAGCTGFRYGQCNQATACLGPIVCRVVTCTPPWDLDPTCTTAVRTDNNTRFHNRPCLQEDPGNPEGALVAVQLAPGGVRFVGYVLAT
ncbi:MAG: twin-arginine translocation signal domain-containing protein, partial [Acidimicrobiales bacterium]|nr:twin-arginine translocation signal domain-containing protein [Acidimicrobiales bacterium]